MPFSESINPAPAVSGLGVFLDSEKGGAPRGMAAIAAAREGDSLPCLSSNNSNERGAALSSYQRKNAFIINENLNFCIERFGVEKIGFLTLTFPSHLSLKEANRRFNSLSSRFLDKHFEHWVCVREFTASGRPHFHLVVVCKVDIRTGFNFENYLRMLRLGRTRESRRKHAVELKAISRALTTNTDLRAIWTDLRRILPLYQFGRSELIPIRKTAQALARYVGGYIRKSMDFRPAEAKGARLITYSKNFPRKVVGHAWAFATEGSRFWRQKVQRFAELLRIKNFEGLSARLGPRWAWWFGDVIQSINLLPFIEDGASRMAYVNGLDPERMSDSFLTGKWDSLCVQAPRLPEIDGKPAHPSRRLQPFFDFLLSNWDKSREQIAKESEALRNARKSVRSYLTVESMIEARKKLTVARPAFPAVPPPDPTTAAALRARNYCLLVHRFNPLPI